MDVLKVEPSLENGTGDKVPQREHGEEGSHLCSQRSEVEILQEKLSAAQEVGVVITSLGAEITSSNMGVALCTSTLSSLSSACMP